MSQFSNQQPTANLTIRQGPCPGRLIRLTKPVVGIGRAETNDVVVSQPEISRHHCCLAWNGSDYVLQDLASRNGTYVNGMRVRTSEVLYEGDYIGVGQSLLLAFSGHEPESEPTMEASPAGHTLSGPALGAVPRRDADPAVAYAAPDRYTSSQADVSRILLAPATFLSSLVGALSAAAAGIGIS